MRAKHRITIDRAMEVIAVDDYGRLVFRCNNGRNVAGDVAVYTVKGGNPYMMIDGIKMPATKIAWMIQRQEYPRSMPMTRNHSRDDFRISNLTLSLDELIWGAN